MISSIYLDKSAENITGNRTDYYLGEKESWQIITDPEECFSQGKTKLNPLVYTYKKSGFYQININLTFQTSLVEGCLTLKFNANKSYMLFREFANVRYEVDKYPVWFTQIVQADAGVTTKFLIWSMNFWEPDQPKVSLYGEKDLIWTTISINYLGDSANAT